MQVDLPDNQRLARPQDWKQLGDITGEAFLDDPVNKWVFQTPGSIRSMFSVLAREMYVGHGHCYLAGDDGATMWLPPGAKAAPTILGIFHFALGQLSNGTPGAIPRGMALSDRMAEWHPKEPHAYLFSIGTRKASRGTGLGKALLAPVLAACDRDKIPVYLENSNPMNSGFYGAHGFEPLGTFEAGPGGPIMEPMWRTPQT